MQRVIILLLFGFFAAPAAVCAASFDCSKARSLVEETVCSDPALSRLDEQMAPLYMRAKSKTPNQPAFLARARQSLNERAACKDKACVFAWFASRHRELLGEPSNSSEQCLPYDHAIRLTGKLAKLTYPGPPNFKSVRDGDAPETGFYLLLKRKACMSGDADSPDEYSQKNIMTVQLLLDQSGYNMLRPLLGQTLTLQGQPMAAHTGHHHAPLLFDGASVINAFGR